MHKLKEQMLPFGFEDNDITKIHYEYRYLNIIISLMSYYYEKMGKRKALSLIPRPKEKEKLECLECRITYL